MVRIFSFVGALLVSLFAVPAALAVTLPNAPCTSDLFGCGGGAKNVIMSALIGPNGIAVMLLQISAGLAVLFIIWAGFQMVISMGEEGKLTQYKWGMAYALIGLSVSILAQFVISTVGTQNYGQVGAVTNLPLNLLASGAKILRIMLNAAFVIILVIAALKMLYAQGKADDYNTGKKMLTWAIVGAVLVNLSAALVTVVIQFFGV